MFSKALTPLLVIFGFVGIILAFFTGFLHKIIVQSKDFHGKDQENESVALVFVCLGACETISGFLFGKLGDKYDIYNLI